MRLTFLDRLITAALVAGVPPSPRAITAPGAVPRFRRPDPRKGPYYAAISGAAGLDCLTIHYPVIDLEIIRRADFFCNATELIECRQADELIEQHYQDFAPSAIHFADPTDPGMIQDWLATCGTFAAAAADGCVYVDANSKGWVLAYRDDDGDDLDDWGYAAGSR